MNKQTLDECRRKGADARGYGWAPNPPGDYSEEQRRAYRQGYAPETPHGAPLESLYRQGFPRRLAVTSRASYWELMPGRFQAFASEWMPESDYVDNGAGYFDLNALRALKGDPPC